MGTRRWIGVVAALLFGAQVSGAAGTEVSLPAAGFAFRPPPGWTARQTPQGAVLGHATIPGLLVVFRHEASTPDDLRRLFAQGVTDGGTRIAPSGPVEPLGRRGIAGPLAGTSNGAGVKGWGAMVLAPEGGGGAAVLAVTSADAYGPSHREAVEQVVRSLRFLEPDRSLAARFVGVWWHYEKSGIPSSYSTRESTVALRADGTFVMGGETGYSNDAGSALGTGAASGRWEVRGTLEEGELVLTYAGGGRDEISYVVHRENGRAFLGTMYYFDGQLYAKNARP